MEMISDSATKIYFINLKPALERMLKVLFSKVRIARLSDISFLPIVTSKVAKVKNNNVSATFRQVMTRCTDMPISSSNDQSYGKYNSH